MVLQSEIQNRITRHEKSAVIMRAIQHQNRLKFHAEVSITEKINQPLTNFLSWVGSLIPQDKFDYFKQLFRYPLKTNEVTGNCFDKLSRIFEGRNPVFNYQFLNADDKDDWEWYRKEVLKEPTIWQTKGWDIFKTEINSILIVDIPREQSTTEKYSQPYFYWLTIDNVIDYEINEQSGNMDFIIFNQEDGTIAVIDDTSYRIFSKDKSGNIETLLLENPHELGYCPARFFWNTPISLAEQDVKESPLTKQLEALDWLLFYHISKRHLDMYASYPIYSGYEENCDYENDKGDHCDHGFLKNVQGYYILDQTGALCKCPKCGTKKLAGVGSYIEIPIPTAETPDMRNPVQLLTADIGSLEYNVKELQRLRDDIVNAVIGTDNEIINNQALNEKQVEANYQSQTAILNRLKKGFESAMQFVDETICRLRYGNSFVSAKINLGTEFFTLTATELRNRYKTMKDTGASESELDAMQTQILETEYRNDPTQLSRMVTLADIEPYRHLTTQEVVELYKEGIIDDATLRMKLNFSELIRRFERENINILEFGTKIPYYKKIQTIIETIKSYVSKTD